VLTHRNLFEQPVQSLQSIADLVSISPDQRLLLLLDALFVQLQLISLPLDDSEIKVGH